jgi:hypothetical protein
MAITRDAVNKRIAQLAQRLGVCATHGIKLRCSHEYLETHEWTGTPEELAEAADLMRRMKPYLAPMTPSGQLCPTCPSHEPLWCEMCYEAQASKALPIVIPDEVMTQAQYDRYRELFQLMREKPPALPASVPWEDVSSGTKDIRLPEPPALPVPVPTPAPVVTPVPDIQAGNVILNTPEVIDDDDEVDDSTIAELQDMIAKLTDQLRSRR